MAENNKKEEADYGGRLRINSANFEYTTDKDELNVYPFYVVSFNVNTWVKGVLHHKDYANDSLFNPLQYVSSKASPPGYFIMNYKLHPNDAFNLSYHFPNPAKLKSSEQTPETKKGEELSLFMLFLLETAFRQDKLFIFTKGSNNPTEEIKRKVAARTLTEQHTYEKNPLGETFYYVITSMIFKLGGSLKFQDLIPNTSEMTNFFMSLAEKFEK